MTAATTLEAERTDIAALTPVDHDLEPGDGGILCRVDQFALTSNNVTYAAHGEDFGYWRFFPASGPARGVVPVWGFASIVASRVDDLAEGERLYGYWPMASHARLAPSRVTARGFVDAAPHRRDLPAVYNGYQRIGPDGLGDERLWALFRPLYITSFLLALDLAGRPGTQQAVLASASSKTALGMAQAVRAGVGGSGHDRPALIGLTSPANRAFVERAGGYDRVLAYDDVDGLDAGTSTVFIDFSGNGAIRRAVHERLGDALAASLIVGDTHWTAANAAALPGPASEMFFAPTLLAARLAEWGQAGFDARLADAWTGFTASTAGWLDIAEPRGVAATVAAWTDLVGGAIDPARGIVASVMPR